MSTAPKSLIVVGAETVAVVEGHTQGSVRARTSGPTGVVDGGTRVEEWPGTWETPVAPSSGTVDRDEDNRRP